VAADHNGLAHVPQALSAVRELNAGRDQDRWQFVQQNTTVVQSSGPGRVAGHTTDKL